MKKINDPIANSLGIKPLNEISIPQENLPPKIYADEFKVESDAENARQSLIHTIQKSSDAFDEIVDIAISGQMPQAFDSAANLMRAIIAGNKELMAIHKAKKEILTPVEVEEKSSCGQSAEVINNNQFNLTTTEMLKFLKDSSENE